MKNNIKVILCPSYDIAMDYIEKNGIPEATVEAEYGDYCIEGSIYTLAHHGERANNPAPCNNTDVKPLESGTILISHIDLDSLGGIMRLMDCYMSDRDFWESAEFIDVNGSHHKKEIPAAHIEIMDAYDAWYSEYSLGKLEVATDVTDFIKSNIALMGILFDEYDIERSFLIRKGKEYAENTQKEIEECLVYESDYVRIFVTTGPSCCAAYYSPKKDKIIPATIQLGSKNNITLGFADGGKICSAREIVQSLWGKDAGGRDGIAGSPRGKEMSMDDIYDLKDRVTEMLKADY